MNSGKSTSLLQAAYNYEERGQHVLLAKPEIDTKGADQISSRLGMTRPVDFLIAPGRRPARAVRRAPRARAAACRGGARPRADVAGAASMSPASSSTRRSSSPATQVDDLLRIVVLDGVPVLAYGIRTDFRTAGVPRVAAAARARPQPRGAQDDLPLRAQGPLQRPARRRPVRLRRRPGRDRRAVGRPVTYESMCAECYLRESGGRLDSDPDAASGRS